MGTPVGKLTSGVLVPPAKLIMAPFLDVVDFRSLSQPGVPVDVGGRVGFLEGSALGSTADVTGYLLDLSDPALPDDPNGGKKSLTHIASLLGAYLENPSGFLGYLADLLALLDGKGEGLFAINVLACLHGLNGDSGVPMVRSTNRYKVNVLALQNLPVILVALGFALGFALAFALAALWLCLCNGFALPCLWLAFGLPWLGLGFAFA